MTRRAHFADNTRIVKQIEGAPLRLQLKRTGISTVCQENGCHHCRERPARHSCAHKLKSPHAAVKSYLNVFMSLHVCLYGVKDVRRKQRVSESRCAQRLAAICASNRHGQLQCERMMRQHVLVDVLRMLVHCVWARLRRHACLASGGHSISLERLSAGLCAQCP